MSARRLVPCVLLAAALVAGCASGNVAPLPPPPTVKLNPTTSIVPDFSGVALPAVAGRTTTTAVRVGGGHAALRGKVISNGAPVPGATVRLERFVNDASASMEVIANAEGGWAAENVFGGRFRVRAFRAPDATMASAQVVFVGDGETRTIDLVLDRVAGGTSVNGNIAPDPPILGDTANVVVAVTTRVVDNGGIARAAGQAGVPVVLVTAGGLAILTPNPAVTNAAGRAEWTVRCSALENQGLSAVLPDGSQTSLNVSGCRPRPTTTLPATTVAPPAGGLQPLQTTTTRKP